jgi:hypothetical protein
MAFMIYCIDKPGHAEVRAANRPAHVDHLTRHERQLVVAGPLLSPDGLAMIGSLIVLDADDRAAAEAFVAADPYTGAGLFQSVTITPYRKVFPRAAQ